MTTSGKAKFCSNTNKAITIALFYLQTALLTAITDSGCGPNCVPPTVKAPSPDVTVFRDTAITNIIKVT